MKINIVRFIRGYAKRLQTIPIFIGTIYLTIILIMQSISNDITITGIFALFLFCLSVLIMTGIMKIFGGKVVNCTFEYQNAKSKLYGSIIFAITVGVFILYLAGQYPGGMSPDTVVQYSQAVGETNYNDWHPVLHTLLFFTLPLKTGHHLGFIVFLQLVYFSLAFSYLSYVLLVNGCPPKFVFFMSIYIWINPFMITYMMYPWKDIAFMIFAVLLFAYYIQVICTRGDWLSKRRNQILFVATAVVCMTIRHNGILFVLPLFFIALRHLLKKELLFTIIFCCIGILGIRLLYSYLAVEKPGGRTLEVAGLPATVWCNVMQKNPMALPEDTRNAFYTLASQETYETEYVTGNFNVIKVSDNFADDVLNEMSYGDIILYTAQCFWYAPQESMEAVAKLTELVWGVGGKDNPISIIINENSYGISYQPFPSVEEIVSQIKNFFSIGIGNILFGSHGYKLLLLLILACLLLTGHRISVIHIIPLFCYNFGTMLLLSGRDYRFFLLNIPLLFPTIFIMLKDQRKFKEKETALVDI